jgi:NAD(P)-dependent dehydrogenase (short-subunit alcohol dehydrogenase family)
MNHRDKTKLDGQYALVTGGSRGIGQAIARSLAGAGCSVAVASRQLQDCEAAAQEIVNTLGVAALGLQCDVSKQKSVHDLFEQLRRWTEGRLDILVCNAGYPFLQEIWNTPLDATPAQNLENWYLDIFRTDTMGSVFCTYEALPLMIARRSGSIIYISSTPALEGYQGVAYTVAKAAILGLMKDVAREYGKFNIRANALALGSIQTPATYDQLDPESRKSFAEDAPLRRWGEPEEVGRAALFLASDLSSFVTGQTLVVDGGTVRW